MASALEFGGSPPKSPQRPGVKGQYGSKGKMTRSNQQDFHRAKAWCTGFLMAILIGSGSVAYAYSGDQIPKNPTTPLILALAASFGAR